MVIKTVDGIVQDGALVTAYINLWFKSDFFPYTLLN